MEIYYFIYTRILTEDYQAMYFPSEQQCPRVDVFDKFRELARGIINTDNYNVDLKKPIWLLAKLNGYTLWGVGIENKMLDPDFANDRVGRSIRGFFGLIYKGTPQCIPYDMLFFKHVYASLIVPNWNADMMTCFHEGVVCDLDFSQYNSIIAEDCEIAINTNPNKTVILGDVDTKRAISQALYIPNTGIVVGLQQEAHAFSERYKYPNVWIEGHERAEFTYPLVKEVEPEVTKGRTQCDNPWFTTPNKEDSFTQNRREFAKEPREGYEELPKKVFGSKKIKGIITLLVALLASCFMIKKCQTGKMSSSGQTTIEYPENPTNRQ